MTVVQCACQKCQKINGHHGSHGAVVGGVWREWSTERSPFV